MKMNTVLHKTIYLQDKHEFLLKLFSLRVFFASTACSKVSHAVYFGELGLYCLYNVHVVWNVDITHVSARDEQVVHTGHSSTSVPVQNLLQPDVHESVHVNNASPRRALVSQVNGGHLAMQTLQENHQTVLSDGAFTNGMAHVHVHLCTEKSLTCGQCDLSHSGSNLTALLTRQTTHCIGNMQIRFVVYTDVIQNEKQ